MLNASNLHDYQKKMINFQCSHPESAVFADMGLGKSIVTLMSIVHLLNTGFLRGVIIVAPIRVCRLVWRQEAARWSETGHLKFSMVMGTKDQRTRALLRPADIYLTNFENLGWLAETIQTYFIKKQMALPFNGLVWDELSKMKNSSTNRVKSIKKILSYFKWKTGLTGTPASNGIRDLHGQFLVLDEGKRLGVSKTAFRTRFYKKEGPFKEVAYEDSERTIANLIGDMTINMSAEDYNPLPDLMVNNIEIEMPPALRASYDMMEKDFFLQLDSGAEVEVFNQASLMNKLCLSEGTLVLTRQGWIPIERISNIYEVWDGESWVSVSGLLYNGYSQVIDCWGVRMTPDHLVLTTHGWRTANDCMQSQGLNRYGVRLPDSVGENTQKRTESMGVESGMCLWKHVGDGGDKPSTLSRKTPIVWVSAQRSNSKREETTQCPISRVDRHSTVDYLEKYEVKMSQPLGQGLVKLWRARHSSLSRMVRFIRGVLEGYVPRVPRSFNDRTKRCESELLSRKLQMGYYEKTIKQQEDQCIHSNTSGNNDDSTGGTPIQIKTNYDLQTEGVGMVRCGFNKTRVYDIANAGPLNRFTVLGSDGVPLIVHNCQFSNGSMYPVAGMPLWEPIHALKLDALEDIIDEAQGSPVLCWYQYRSDAQRIMERFKALRPINLTECKSESSLLEAMRRWGDCDCPLMISHHLSGGHGLDGFQKAGHIITWFGITWSLDGYDQANARIRRQGQGVPVICHRIMMKDTLDQAQALALDAKATTQINLRNSIKEYRKSRNL